jgi:ubiquinone/menaquinone biosynthesis C-methylase UbiE
MLVWLLRFSWLDITALYAGDEKCGKLLDGAAEDEIRSETGQKEPFHQRDGGFAWMRSRGTSHGALLRVSRLTSPPLKGAKTVNMARPPYNSGKTRNGTMLRRIPHAELEVITGKQTAEEYLAMQRRLGKFYLKKFLEILRDQNKTGDFLEIGSGPGYQTARVAQLNQLSRIQALEPSADMIAIARSYLEQQGLGDRVKLTEGSVEDTNLVESLGKFDLIYSTFSLHHWKDPIKAIHNLYRVLKDEGALLIYDFERHWLTYYLPVGRKGISESIRASYTPKEIASMIDGLNMENFLVRRHFPYLSVIIRK